MNFKESLMSTTPKNLPKRTRILVKDLLFQEKHHLTDTQIDIMSYIFNAFTWAMKIDGYMVLTNKKITDDMPQIGQKTLEASLKELENKGLIDKNIVKVPNWNNARVRGIKISSEGMEYNGSLYSPSHLAITNAFQERIKELEELLKRKEPQIESETEVLAPKDETIEEKEENKTIDSEIKEDFIKSIRNRFILTSEPICNMVDGWQPESTFYINSYGQLSSTSPTKECEQIKSPMAVNKFWTWLFQNQNRVGTIVDLKKMREKIIKLNQKYRDKKIKINNTTLWISEIVPMNQGFSLKVRYEHGEVAVISNKENKPVVYGYNALEKFICKLL